MIKNKFLFTLIVLMGLYVNNYNGESTTPEKTPEKANSTKLGYAEKLKVFSKNNYGKMSFAVASIIAGYAVYKYFIANEESEETEEEN